MSPPLRQIRREKHALTLLIENPWRADDRVYYLRPGQTCIRDNITCQVTDQCNERRCALGIVWLIIARNNLTGQVRYRGAYPTTTDIYANHITSIGIWLIQYSYTPPPARYRLPHGPHKTRVLKTGECLRHSWLGKPGCTRKLGARSRFMTA